MSTIEKSSLINWGRGLRLVRYGIVFGAGKAIAALPQAAAVASCLLRRRYISGTVREQPCRWPRCRLDRSDDIAGVISKEIEQRTPSRSARVRQAEPARDVRLERPAETVFGPTCEQMQMTPHLPQEAVRLDQPRRLEWQGAPRGAGVGPECALQVSEATGASLHVGLVLQSVHIARCMATCGRQGAADRVPPASGVGSGETRSKLGIEGSKQALTAPQVPPVNQVGKHG